MSSETAELCFPALVIDGSSSFVFTGILGADSEWLSLSEQVGAPLEELFHSVEKTLNAAQFELSEIRSFVYCEGPGSVLGLRLCAMAIETWSRLHPDSAKFFSYNSLRLTASALKLREPKLNHALIVSDWKKAAWNAIRIGSDPVGVSEVIDDSQVKQWDGTLYHLPQRKGWQAPPENAVTLRYDPSALCQVHHETGLLQQTEGILLYNSGVNTFQKWTPTRHRVTK
ncbi:hypothetical protein N9Q19_00510 [Puniceicoccaceae bacterium]|nr:hypothetical protein [Puniceicoccaceae bacterium]MDC0497477.1 hypothetical protein [bacterium]